MSKRVLIILCLILLAVPLAWTQGQSEFERTLNNDYKGKVLTQRRFLTGAQLTYAEDGTSQDSAIGPWTTDAELRLTAVSLPDEHTIQIQGERLFLAYDPAAREFRDVLSEPDRLKALNDKQLQDLQVRRNLVINITSSGAWDEAKARAAFAEVFLRPDERLSSVVPEFWRSFLRRLEGAPAPATVSSTSSPGAPDTPPALKVGNGVSAPTAVVTPDPAYSYVARAAKYQGTTLLWLLLGEDGVPHDIRIARPAGLGLDEKAVEAVREWKFQPAMREGKPVAVQINVEVNFHLY